MTQPDTELVKRIAAYPPVKRTAILGMWRDMALACRGNEVKACAMAETLAGYGCNPFDRGEKEIKFAERLEALIAAVQPISPRNNKQKEW